MPTEIKYIRKIDSPWYGKPEYIEGLSVPEINLKYGSFFSKLKTMPFFMQYLSGCIIELKKSNKSITRNPYSGKTNINSKELSAFESRAMELGISGIGYVRLQEKHLFKDSIALFKNAIVFIMEMKKPDIQSAPSIRANREIYRTYYELSRVANLMSDFLRSSRFNAHPISAISNNLNLTVLARDAGLGGFGKHGLLITPEYGPSIRIGAILTDIENLPFYTGTDFEWVSKYCESCNACVRVCPSRAIYKEPVKLLDGSETHIDYKKCAVPFTKQHGCTLCIKECTFFKGKYEKIENIFTRSKI